MSSVAAGPDGSLGQESDLVRKEAQIGQKGKLSRSLGEFLSSFCWKPLSLPRALVHSSGGMFVQSPDLTALLGGLNRITAFFIKFLLTVIPVTKCLNLGV